MQKWEYEMLIAQTDIELIDRLNEMGEQSWELVSLVDDNKNYTAVLKRPKD